MDTTTTDEDGITVTNSNSLGASIQNVDTLESPTSLLSDAPNPPIQHNSNIESKVPSETNSHSLLQDSKCTVPAPYDCTALTDVVSHSPTSNVDDANSSTTLPPDSSISDSLNPGTSQNEPKKKTHKSQDKNVIQSTDEFLYLNQLANQIENLSTEVPTRTLSQTPSVSLDQVDTDMMQIDSVLKALNTGTFDKSNMMTINQLTSQIPQNVLSTVQLRPSAGLSLISELVSDDDKIYSSSESDGSSCSSDEDTSGSETERKNVVSNSKKCSYPMVKGEIDYKDLPPDEPVVTCPTTTELTAVGKVLHTAEKLIIIEAYPDSPILSDGTVLWTSQRSSLGKIFETFGPVKKPFYSIRITNVETDESTSSKVSPDETMFAALNDTEFTKYAFVEQLMKQKGSDASWSNDLEVPQEYQDYSDDEKERIAKGKGKSTESYSVSRKKQTRVKKKTKRFIQTANTGQYNRGTGFNPPSYSYPINDYPAGDNRGTGFNPPSYSYPINDYPAGDNRGTGFNPPSYSHPINDYPAGDAANFQFPSTCLPNYQYYQNAPTFHLQNITRFHLPIPPSTYNISPNIPPNIPPLFAPSNPQVPHSNHPVYNYGSTSYPDFDFTPHY